MSTLSTPSINFAPHTPSPSMSSQSTLTPTPPSGPLALATASFKHLLIPQQQILFDLKKNQDILATSLEDLRRRVELLQEPPSPVSTRTPSLELIMGVPLSDQEEPDSIPPFNLEDNMIKKNHFSCDKT